MKSFLALALVLAVLAGQSWAWGEDGHKIIAQIGYNFLNDGARSKVDAQLGSLSLADIAAVPDSYDHNSDGSGRWSADLHYVDIPSTSKAFFYDNSSCPDEGCVVSAIFNYSKILYNEKNYNPMPLCNTSSTTEPCALSFLVHFVGDSHQPLHVAYTVDKGGNDFSVSFYGSTTNLHSVWDGKIINKYLGSSSWMSLASELTNWANANPSIAAAIELETSPNVWANESFNYVKNVAYNFIPGDGGIAMNPVPHTLLWGLLHKDWSVALDQQESASVSDHITECSRMFTPEQKATSSSSYVTYIGDPYYERAVPIVKARLVEAGLRLGTLLNNIYS